MKILVLGGTRFVGLRLVRLLAGEGHDVTILNRGRTAAELPGSVKRLYADRRKPAEVQTALRGLEFDAVYDITGYQVVNVESTASTLLGRTGHYIFQSTGAVYAPADILPVREDSAVIDACNAPTDESVYGLEKAECERYLLRMHAERRLPATIFRSPVIYGPENWMDDREGSFFFRLLKGRGVLVPGSGATVLHYVHVDDVARAYLAATGKKETHGQVYNIASAEAITINGYIDVIARATGCETNKVNIQPHVAGTLKRPVFFFRWDRCVVYDISKAARDFGYQPAYGMADGMKHTYEWWRQNRGVQGIQFQPGKLGHDVDLAFEDEVLAGYGSE